MVAVVCCFWLVGFVWMVVAVVVFWFVGFVWLVVAAVVACFAVGWWCYCWCYLFDFGVTVGFGLVGGGTVGLLVPHLQLSSPRIMAQQ